MQVAPERAEPLGQLGIRGEVQVGEQQLPGPQQLDLRRLRLLDLERPSPPRRTPRRRRERCAPPAPRSRRRRSSCPRPAPLWISDLVAVLDQLAHPGRRDRDPVLVGLDLGRDPDLHADGAPRRRRARSGCRGSPARRTSPPGSMQRSGGSAPRALMLPRASSRTAAAIGAAVETTPPPSPHSACGSVTARIRTVRPWPEASTMCTETVCGDGGWASRAAALTSSSGAAAQLAQPLQQRPRRARAGSSHSRAAEALAEGAQLRVQRVDRLRAARSGRRSRPRRPELSGSISPRLAVAQHDRRQGELVDQGLQRVGKAESRRAGRGRGRRRRRGSRRRRRARARPAPPSGWSCRGWSRSPGSRCSPARSKSGPSSSCSPVTR